MKKAYFGGGCFWCTEAVFSKLKGVLNVTPGYSGGSYEEPSYEKVSSGVTGHAEVIEIEFDPKKINYSELLNVFFSTHDPTTRNRQGNDVGSQYRSIILFTDEDQQKKACMFIDELEAKKVFNKPIVTEIEPFKEFFQAEKYHQEYYDKNTDKPYCQIVISPKLEKLRQTHKKLLK